MTTVRLVVGLALLSASFPSVVAWRKGGFVPDEMVGTWKCIQRNHTRPDGVDGELKLGEPIKKTGTIGYSGAEVWLMIDHEADKLYTTVDSLVWWDDVATSRKEVGDDNKKSEYITKYKIAFYESTPKTIPDPFFKFACRVVTFTGRHMDVLGNYGWGDCTFPTGPHDAHFITHCSQTHTPYLMGEEQEEEEEEKLQLIEAAPEA